MTSVLSIVQPFAEEAKLSLKNRFKLRIFILNLPITSSVGMKVGEKGAGMKPGIACI